MVKTNDIVITETKKAVFLAIAASFVYSIMALLVKLAANDSTESMTVFFRFSVSMFWVLLVLGYKKLRGKQVALKTKYFWLHVLRSVMGVIAMFSLYYSFKHVPLADAISLSQTYTLFIPILSLIFFKTTTSSKNWIALFIGFTGIIFILKPFSNTFNPMVLFALISGIAVAISFLGVHELAKHDKPYTIMLYYFPLTVIISGIFAFISWKTPSPNILIILLLVGVAGTVYQEFFTRAMMYAPPKIVGPLLYFGIVFSGLFDWIFWKHIPNIYFWIGTSLIISGCVFVIKNKES